MFAVTDSCIQSGYDLKKMKLYSTIKFRLRPEAIIRPEDQPTLIALTAHKQTKWPSLRSAFNPHTNHNQNKKAHRNGIKKPKTHYAGSMKGVDAKFRRNQKYARLGTQKALAAKKAEAAA
ncbi:Ribosomal L29e protein family, partial [Rhizoctonia solani]